jgi:hypothetical protein
MHLIQVFIPLAGGDGKRFPRSHFEALEETLVAEFTGFTSYPRAPASGLWKGPNAEVQQDDLIIYEIMTDNVEDDWWKTFRQSLEELFQQDKILIRSQLVWIH